MTLAVAAVGAVLDVERTIGVEHLELKRPRLLLWYAVDRKVDLNAKVSRSAMNQIHLDPLAEYVSSQDLGGALSAPFAALAA